MLTRLFIQNLATVQKQIVEFKDGFSVLTGETGAGKSIIIRSINMILGEKISKDLIRTNEDFLSVEAVFDISDNPPIQHILNDLDIEFENELTIRRKSHRNGKSSIYINDYTSKLSQLADLGQYLIDLHGQHAQQILLQPTSHIDFLDQFAGLRDRVTRFTDLYETYRQKQRLKTTLETDAVERAREKDFLQFQIDEIENAGFTEDEETTLQDEFQQLTHAEQIIESLLPVTEWQTGAKSPLSEISTTLKRLRDLSGVSQEMVRFADEIQNGLITLEEVAADVAQYTSKLEINPPRLEAVNERLSELDLLKRKYGQTLGEILKFKGEKEVELSQISKVDEGYDELDGEINALSRQLDQLGDEIAEVRESKKVEFEALVMGNLKELGMEKCLFNVDINPVSNGEDSNRRFNQKGKNNVEFLIATNPGNPLKPLSKIASGGEVSRIMLAIKTSLTEDINNGTMIFDEVDAGISGRVSEIVGMKLSELGNRRQVICITHSPQIAAKATTHYRVEKDVGKKSSSTKVTLLDKNERIEEIAKFLGGDSITEKTKSLARDMLG